MNIGLKREKFGDIAISPDKAQLIVASEIADYVQLNVTAIGKAPVRFEPIDFSKYIITPERWEEDTTTVTSLRLDTIVANLYRISRGKAAPLIENGLVKVNWKVIVQPSFFHSGR